MKYTEKAVLLTTTIIMCSCAAVKLCILLSDPEIMSDLENFDVVEWTKRVFSQSRSINGTGYICTTDKGRLGNHMFHYASLFGIAKNSGFKIIIPKNSKIKYTFKIDQAVKTVDNYACVYFEKVLEKNGCCTYDGSFLDLRKGGNYIIGDWLQSWKYFGGYIDEVRKEFSFKDEIYQSAVYITENIRKSRLHVTNVTLVGIHIRAGDITQNDSLFKMGFQNAPKSYVHKAVDLVISLYQNVLFIVCSNDIDRAKEILKNKITETFYFSISPAYDMAILSKCDHVIMTVGTFGWWAGFLSRGTVIYYKYPYRNDSDIWKQFTYDDYYLPEWIGID